MVRQDQFDIERLRKKNENKEVSKEKVEHSEKLRK